MTVRTPCQQERAAALRIGPRGKKARGATRPNRTAPGMPHLPAAQMPSPRGSVKGSCRAVWASVWDLPPRFSTSKGPFQRRRSTQAEDLCARVFWLAMIGGGGGGGGPGSGNLAVDTRSHSSLEEEERADHRREGWTRQATVHLFKNTSTTTTQQHNNTTLTQS